MVSPPRPAQMQILQNRHWDPFGSCPSPGWIQSVTSSNLQGAEFVLTSEKFEVAGCCKGIEMIGRYWNSVQEGENNSKKQKQLWVQWSKERSFFGGNVFETVELLRFSSFRLLTFDFDVIRISCITGQDSNKSSWEWTVAGWSTLHAQGMCSVDLVQCWIG